MINNCFCHRITLIEQNHIIFRMTVRILGGASEVGSLSVFIEERGMRMLFDNGLTPSRPPKYPLKPPPMDLCFLSHAHIDHSGMIPWVTSQFGVDVITTPPTIAVGTMLLEDTVKVSASEGYPVPFERKDVKVLKRHFQESTFGDVIELGDVDIKLVFAGHIPGAAMFEISADKKILITADINTLDTHLVEGAQPHDCDVLILESTYAGRNHPPRGETEYNFIAKVEEVVDRGGVAIVPSFAVGRSQEVLLILENSGFEVWLDGLGRAVNNEFLRLSEYLRSVDKLGRAIGQTRIIRNRDERRIAMKGEVIVTTSGMLDGGPVLEYLRVLKNDKKSAVLLTGYQVENTNGHSLLETGKIQLQGLPTRIDCEVGFFDFSAHADHNELVKFVNECNPETVILCHGDNREALAEDLKDYEVHLPMEGESIDTV